LADREQAESARQEADAAKGPDRNLLNGILDGDEVQAPEDGDGQQQCRAEQMALRRATRRHWFTTPYRPCGQKAEALSSICLPSGDLRSERILWRRSMRQTTTRVAAMVAFCPRVAVADRRQDRA